jgi:RNA polymerase primary sigma factor
MANKVETASRVAAVKDSIQTYFDQIKKNPLLTFEEELSLSKKIQSGDNAARKKLIESNLRLVIKIAKQYLSSGVPFLDLVQEGNLGLLHAAAKYDYRKHVRFSTYASWWIKQSISRAISNKKRSIRLPHRKEDCLKKIQAAYNNLSQKFLRKPTIEEVSEYLDLERQEILNILSIADPIVSLDSELASEAGTLHDICEDYSYSPELGFIEQNFKDEVSLILSRLTDREQFVLTQRFGLDGGEKATLKHISESLNVSPETVRQIEIRAIKKLRKYSDELRELVH